jgi:hypothetical protein
VLYVWHMCSMNLFFHRRFNLIRESVLTSNDFSLLLITVVEIELCHDLFCFLNQCLYYMCNRGIWIKCSHFFMQSLILYIRLRSNSYYLKIIFNFCFIINFNCEITIVRSRLNSLKLTDWMRSPFCNCNWSRSVIEQYYGSVW